MTQRKKLAILVGGGPAPGINSVIGAATIRAVLEGFEVVGIQDGFEWVMRGNIDHVRPLGIEDVSRIHFRGGSYVGISRANPTTDPELLEQTVISLLRLNVTQLITIGGDDEDPHELAKFAATAGMSLDEFRHQFEYLIADEAPPLVLLEGHTARPVS